MIHEANTEVPPAFQMYAANLQTNPAFKSMDADERGIFITLYLACWTSGRLPVNPEKLTMWVGLPITELSDNVMAFFSSDDEWLWSPSLDKYKQKQNDRKARMVEGGRKGGIKGMKKRWSTDAVVEAINEIDKLI